MKNADFQYIGLSFSKEAYITNFQVPCENFRKRRLFSQKIRVTNGIWRNLCLLHLVHQIDRHLPAALEDTWASRFNCRFFSTATSWTPKNSVGVVCIPPYNHGFLVENGSENKFWGIQFLGLQCSTLDVYGWETVRLIAKYILGGSLGGWFINILRIL